MRYYDLPDGDRGTLAAVDDTGVYDLGSAHEDLRSFRGLARAASVAGEDLDTVADRHLTDADTYSRDALADARRPLSAPEVWAAGVTYERSEQAREAESEMPDIYVRVYDADRPELFFKATPARTVGPGEPVGIRGDADWSVPEPELGVVLYRGRIVGYTVGNDMSSRDIEGENPLYLPQAKVYDRCCAVGPCVASPGAVGDPHDLAMEMRIERDGETVFADETSTGELVRTCEDLARSLAAHNELPDLTVLLTGTSLVPPDDFGLAVGDEIAIDIEGIGELRNPVVEV